VIFIVVSHSSSHFHRWTICWVLFEFFALSESARLSCLRIFFFSFLAVAFQCEFVGGFACPDGVFLLCRSTALSSPPFFVQRFFALFPFMSCDHLSWGIVGANALPGIAIFIFPIFFNLVRLGPGWASVAGHIFFCVKADFFAGRPFQNHVGSALTCRACAPRPQPAGLP